MSDVLETAICGGAIIFAVVCLLIKIFVQSHTINKLENDLKRLESAPIPTPTITYQTHNILPLVVSYEIPGECNLTVPDSLIVDKLCKELCNGISDYVMYDCCYVPERQVTHYEVQLKVVEPDESRRL